MAEDKKNRLVFAANSVRLSGRQWLIVLAVVPEFFEVACVVLPEPQLVQQVFVGTPFDKQSGQIVDILTCTAALFEGLVDAKKPVGQRFTLEARLHPLRIHDVEVLPTCT